MRRQFAWLVALIVVAVIPTIGIAVVVPMAATLARQSDPSTSAFLTNTVIPALILGGPILLALVALVYSFFMREPAAVGVHFKAQSPLR